MKENEVLLELMKLRAIYSLKNDTSATEALDYVIFKLDPPKKQTAITDETDKMCMDMISMVTRMSDYDNDVYNNYLWNNYFNKYSLHTIIHKVCSEEIDSFTVYEINGNCHLCTAIKYEDGEEKAQTTLHDTISKFNLHKYMEPIEIICNADELTLDNLIDLCEALPEQVAYVVEFRPVENIYTDYDTAIKICNSYLFWKSKEIDIDERV